MNYYLSLIFFCLLAALANSQNCLPSGVHISLGDYYASNSSTTVDNILKIMYFNSQLCSQSYVTITESNSSQVLIRINVSSIVTFDITDNSGGELYIITQYIYTFQVGKFNLFSFKKQFNYTIYSNENSTDTYFQTFNFILPERDFNKSSNQSIIFIGMMDISDSSFDTRYYLENYAKRMNKTNIDLIVYLGDMAFNVDDQLYQKGNSFFNEIQNFAAYIPFMPTAGTREIANNFEYYNKMIGSPFENIYNDFFYSFNIGYAHFVQINMAYYFNNAADPTLQNQIFQWLNDDLQNANLRANRMLRPWIIVYGYKSFYCSNLTDPFCGSHIDPAQDLINFENIFKKYKVDLYFSSSYLPVYERTKPIYNNKIYNFGSNYQGDVDYISIVNPQATVYIIDGAAGNDLYYNGETDLSSNLANYQKNSFYSLRVSPFPGIGVMTIVSPTMIEFIQYESYDLEGGLTDYMILINNMTKWEDDWPFPDKVTFITSFIIFVIFGSLILITFMMYIEP